MLGGLASLVALGTAGLAGCSKQPLRLGFLGGLTGPTADLGIAGRDSTLLAVEQFNQRGGFQGQAVELVEFDDRQQPAALNELADRIRQASLAGVVGPMTSSVAEAWIPVANRLGLTTVSPTVTSSDFKGRDDQFFRVCSTTREYAYISAEHHMRASSPKRFALVRDDSNAAYTRSWAQHFADRVTFLGGKWCSRRCSALANSRVRSRKPSPRRWPISQMPWWWWPTPGTRHCLHSCCANRAAPSLCRRPNGLQRINSCQWEGVPLINWWSHSTLIPIVSTRRTRHSRRRSAGGLGDSRDMPKSPLLMRQTSCCAVWLKKCGRAFEAGVAAHQAVRGAAATGGV